MIKRKISLALFLLLLLPAALLAFSSEAEYKAGCSAEEAIGAEVAGVVAVAFALVIFTIALAYMASHMVSAPHLSVWAKDELVHLGLSAFIAVLVPMVFITSCTAVAGYAGGSPFKASYKYLDDLAAKKGFASVVRLTEKSLAYQLDATDYLFIGLPIVGGKGRAPKADKKALSQQEELVIDLLTPAIVSLKVQKLLLTIIEAYGLRVLLPLAILLRVLPFSREAGNFLLALSFGAYVVFPLTYALNAGAAKEITDTVMCEGMANSAACNDGVVDYVKVGSLMPQAILFPNISIVILIGVVMAVTKALNKITAMMG